VRRAQTNGTRGGRLALALMAALAIAGEPAVMTRDVAATASTRSATCTEGSVTWRVDYTLDDAFGGVVRVDNLWQIQSGQPPTSANASTWQLRWDNAADQWPAPGTPASSIAPFQQIEGGLAAFGDWRSVFTSPRLVAPDASCTIYLAPFANLHGLSLTPTVAVLGDDLLQQLNDSTFNQGYAQGYVEADLNAAGIRAEVEGQAGVAWNPTPGTSGLARARTHLMDEFHGLAEWNLTGVVAGQGRNDARYIAAGPTPADVANRRTEVWNKVVATLGLDVQPRSSCVVVVTIPENPSSSSPAYADAARFLNGNMRTAASASATDSLQLVDFGARAASHRYNDPVPWFTGADEATFTTAGRDAYRRAVRDAAHLCADGVVAYGRAGSSAGAALDGRSSVPTGQPYRAQPVAGWQFTGGHRPWLSTVMDDGTILNGSITHIASDATGDDMPLTEFNPDEGTFDTVEIATDRGVTHMTVNDPNKPQGPIPTGFGFADVSRLSADSAVFVGTSGYRFTYQGLAPVGLQDLETQGMWPIVGIVTKKPGTGRYDVVKGQGWENQWSPRELYDATVAADAADGVPADERGALAARACPMAMGAFGGQILDPQGRQVRDCLSPQFVRVLPQSHDLVVGQYFRDIFVLHLDGPDAAGRYRIRVKAEFPLPTFPDPQHPADPTWGIAASPVNVSVDPTGQLGDERFIVGFDIYGPPFGHGGYGGPVEFSYNANEPDPGRRLKPSSAPLLLPQLVPGPYANDPADPNLPRYGILGPPLYDHQGNLWLGAAAKGFTGDGLAVYAKRSGTGRSISTSDCGFDPVKPLSSYQAPDEGDTTVVRKAWGHTCAPDYMIREPAALGHIWDLREDPVTHAVFAIFNLGGTSLLIQPSGTPDALSFNVGNAVVTASQAVLPLLQLDGFAKCDPATMTCQPCPDQPQYWQFGITNCVFETGVRVGGLVVDAVAYDRAGRAWLTLGQWRPALPFPYTRMTQLDGWLESVSTARLAGGELVQLTTRPGVTTTIHAARTSTTATDIVRPGSVAAVDVVNRAPVANCGCADPVSGLGGALVLANETTPASGVRPGTTVEYRVVVPKAGTYTVQFNGRVASGTSGRTLNLAVNGGTARSTTIPVSASFQTISGPALTFGTPGTYTLQVSAPDGGWQLAWLGLRRG
jgi:hypothetical protein